MVLEGLRGYLQLASGLTDVTRARASAAARALVAHGEAAVPAQVRVQVSALTDELIATSRANRELLRGLVRGEVERAVEHLGLVSAAEVKAANDRADRLERRVRDLEVQLNASGGTAAKKSSTRTAKKAGAAKTSAPGKAGT